MVAFPFGLLIRSRILWADFGYNGFISFFDSHYNANFGVLPVIILVEGIIIFGGLCKVERGEP